MGRGFDPNRLRADCYAAGVVSEAVEIILLRQNNLSFGMIARTLEMKPSTVREAYLRGSDRLREYYRRRAEEDAASTPTMEAGSPPTEDRSLTDYEHAKELLRAMRRRTTSPPTPQYDEQDRPTATRAPLAQPEDLLPYIQASSAYRAKSLDARWDRAPALPGSRVNPDRNEREKKKAGERRRT